MKKAILVQVQSNHSEVLYPQIAFLQGECEIEVLTTRKLAAIDVLNGYRAKGVKYSIVPEVKMRFLTINIGAIIKFLAVFTLVFKRADIIVFNSLTVKDCVVSHLISKKTRIFGIIHNVKSFLSKERLLTPLKGVFVLSDDVHRYCLNEYKNNPITKKMSWFIPVSENLISAWANRDIEHKEGPIRIGVIGNVVQEKRDYSSLASAVLKTAKKNDGKYELLLLGRYSEAFLQFIPIGMRDGILTFDRYIPYQEMDEMICSCDVLLYLIHPSLKNSEGYGRTKITGLSTILKTIPILPAGSDGAIIDAYCRNEMILYPGSNVDSFFSWIVEGKISLRTIQERRQRLCIDEYSFLNQKKRYRRGLDLSPSDFG